jgi:peptidoglycan/xylan/chitin deacetylase (PgdA/CDA1 family)
VGPASFQDVTGRALRRLAQVLRARRSVILAYHGVGPTDTRMDPGFLRVRPDTFRSQLDLLRGAAFEFVTVADFVDRARGGVPPPGLAALSFDDGMEDNYSIAWPILREFGLPATVYVTTGLIGEPNPWMPARAEARMMTVAELRELAVAGIEIGAHSVTHPDLSGLDFESCLREMTESRRILEQVTGTTVRTFAYPSCRYGTNALEAARAAGFSAAVTCQGHGSWDPYALKRSLITGKDALPAFLLKLTDFYQPLFDSLPSRLVRSSTRGLRERRRESRAG